MIARRFKVLRTLWRGLASTRLLAEIPNQPGRFYELVLLPGRNLSADPLRELSDVSKDINHPVVSPLYSTLLGDRGCVLAYRVSRHTEVLNVRRKGPMPPADVAMVGVSIASALQIAHQRMLYPSDLSPSTIWHGARGRLSWSGLGMGWLLAEEARLRGASSSIWAYLPEVPSPATPTDDLYALGVLLIELLNGIPPRVPRGGRVICPEQTQAPPPLLRAIRSALDGSAPNARTLSNMLVQAL